LALLSQHVEAKGARYFPSFRWLSSIRLSSIASQEMAFQDDCSGNASGGRQEEQSRFSSLAEAAPFPGSSFVRNMRKQKLLHLHFSGINVLDIFQECEYTGLEGM
jgi:hypothetical protein